MKKLIKCLLTVLMGVSIVACSSKNNDLAIEWGKETKFEDLVSFQLETIGKTQQITPDVIGTYYNYYKPRTSTNALLDVVLQMTNLKNEDLKIASAVDTSFTINEKEYPGYTIAVSEDGKTIHQGATLTSEGTSKIHFYTEIDPKLLDGDITFQLKTKDEDKEQVAAMTFKLSDVASHYESKKLKDVVTIDGTGEITLESTDVAKKIEPAKPTGLYTSDKDLTASNVVSAVLVDQNSNEYPSNMFYEKDDQSNLSAASSTTLAAGKSGTVYFVFEVSDSIANAEKTIRMAHMGKVYTFTF